MKGFKGTEGGWHTRKTSHNCISIKSDESSLIIADLIVNENTNQDEQMFTALCNARLMAHAPNLLECLEKLVTAHENDKTKEYGFWVEAGRNAINKALGF